MAQFLSFVSNYFSSFINTVTFDAVVSLNVVFWTCAVLSWAADRLVLSHRAKNDKDQPNHTSTWVTSLAKWLAKHDIRGMPPTFTQTEYMKILGICFINITVLTMVTVPVTEAVWDAIHDPENRMDYTDAWKWQHEVPCVMFSLVVLDIIFYSVHYGLHASPYFYKNIHKVHHQYHDNLIAIMSVYAHPLEFLACGILGTAAGPVLCNCHPMTACSFVALCTLVGCKDHCGYQTGYAHHRHHQFNKGSFGAIRLIDFFMGTLAK